MTVSVDTIPVTIAYIGGGSLNWAPKLMADLSAEPRLAAEVRLYDLDLPAAQRNARLGARFSQSAQGTPAKYVVADTLKAALTGADVVVISILPGRFDEMAKDIEIPLAYGIPQAVGDTVGPGGFIRAMRAIPMLTDIGHAIAAYAPDAFVCNLTNPMSVLTGALYKAFPGIKAWGECHEVTKLRKQVAWIANREAGQVRWTHRDVDVNVLGINHFTFADKISLRGRDMMAAYRAFAEAHAQTGWVAQEPDPEDEHESYFGDRSKVKFDLLRRFGIPAAAGDRHLAEFVPAGDYLSCANDWAFGLTPVEYRVRYQAQKQQIAADMIDGSRPVQAEKSDEALVDQIAALFGGGPFVSNVNLPNRGQMQGLPEGTIVETNAVFSGLGVIPVVAGALPEALNTQVADHAIRQSALLDAVLKGDVTTLVDLFHSDPLVADLSRDRAYALFSEMVGATREWLPENLKGVA